MTEAPRTTTSSIDTNTKENINIKDWGVELNDSEKELLKNIYDKTKVEKDLRDKIIKDMEKGIQLGLTSGSIWKLKDKLDDKNYKFENEKGEENITLIKMYIRMKFDENDIKRLNIGDKIYNIDTYLDISGDKNEVTKKIVSYFRKHGATNKIVDNNLEEITSNYKAITPYDSPKDNELEKGNGDIGKKLEKGNTINIGNSKIDVNGNNNVINLSIVNSEIIAAIGGKGNNNVINGNGKGIIGTGAVKVGAGTTEEGVDSFLEDSGTNLDENETKNAIERIEKSIQNQENLDKYISEMEKGIYIEGSGKKYNPKEELNHDFIKNNSAYEFKKRYSGEYNPPYEEVVLIQLYIKMILMKNDILSIGGVKEDLNRYDTRNFRIDGIIGPQTRTFVKYYLDNFVSAKTYEEKVDDSKVENEKKLPEGYEIYDNGSGYIMIKSSEKAIIIEKSSVKSDKTNIINSTSITKEDIDKILNNPSDYSTNYIDVLSNDTNEINKIKNSKLKAGLADKINNFRIGKNERIITFNLFDFCNNYSKDGYEFYIDESRYAFIRTNESAYIINHNNLSLSALSKAFDNGGMSDKNINKFISNSENLINLRNTDKDSIKRIFEEDDRRLGTQNKSDTLKTKINDFRRDEQLEQYTF